MEEVPISAILIDSNTTLNLTGDYLERDTRQDGLYLKLKGNHDTMFFNLDYSVVITKYMDSNGTHPLEGKITFDFKVNNNTDHNLVFHGSELDIVFPKETSFTGDGSENSSILVSIDISSSGTITRYVNLKDLISENSIVFQLINGTTSSYSSKMSCGINTYRDESFGEINIKKINAQNTYNYLLIVDSNISIKSILYQTSNSTIETYPSENKPARIDFKIPFKIYKDKCLELQNISARFSSEIEIESGGELQCKSLEL